MSASSEDQNETKTHYFTPTIASKYTNTVFNSPLYNEWISSLIFDRLELQPGHTLVDMGCGPGVQSTIILNKMKNEIHVIGKYCNVFERFTSKKSVDYVVTNITFPTSHSLILSETGHLC
jgi:ubiquinone/menaquinone biosynthesis C-methylase UbiE